MAKNGKTKLISVGISVAVILAGIVSTFTIHGENIDHNAEAINEVKVEGCTPANEQRITIAVMQQDISTVKDAQEDIKTEQRQMRKEQRAGFDKIMDKLDEK